MECCATKTKVNSQVNLKLHTQSSEPIKTPSKYLYLKPSKENMCKRVMIGFGFTHQGPSSLKVTRGNICKFAKFPNKNLQFKELCELKLWIMENLNTPQSEERKEDMDCTLMFKSL